MLIFTEEVDVKVLQNLAQEFGLPCIVREDEVTIVGEAQLIVFKRQIRSKVNE